MLNPKFHAVAVLVMLIVMLLAAGCKDRPQVSGMITVSVANQLPGGQLGEAAFAALLSWVNSQLAAEGVLVTLQPLPQGRGPEDAAVVLVPADHTGNPTMGQVLVKAPTGLKPDSPEYREAIRDQVLSAFGK